MRPASRYKTAIKARHDLGLGDETRDADFEDEFDDDEEPGVTIDMTGAEPQARSTCLSCVSESDCTCEGWRKRGGGGPHGSGEGCGRAFTIGRGGLCDSLVQKIAQILSKTDDMDEFSGSSDDEEMDENVSDSDVDEDDEKDAEQAPSTAPATQVDVHRMQLRSCFVR